MKALIFRETGEPQSVLQLAEIPTPPVAAGEALVRVLLSPINPSDLHMVRGRYGYQPALPASPGAEGVGIVEAVGPGVQGSIVGTRVVFVHTWNTWREQIVWPVDRLVPVPDGLDDPAAATAYTNPLTAWALTRSSHHLQEGDWLLQTAAASSVGKLVLQLAHRTKKLYHTTGNLYPDFSKGGKEDCARLSGRDTRGHLSGRRLVRDQRIRSGPLLRRVSVTPLRTRCRSQDAPVRYNVKGSAALPPV